MNYLHVTGIFLRNFFLLRRSLHRILSLFYWVTLELFMWGFLTLWIKDIAPADIKINFIITLLGALIFWDLFTRSQQTITVSFLEDIWSRNLINIFGSPISVKEFVAGLILLSLFQSLISFVVVALLAWLLYALEIWNLGFYILPLVLNIFIFGWALGLFTLGIIIRFGPSVDIIAWSIPVLFQPLSAVFYPITILPAFLQKVALFVPTMHLFEGMRFVLSSEALPVNHILLATGLNVLYLILGASFFYWMLKAGKKRGLLSRLITD